MKIAIIGTGIAGNAAALALMQSSNCQIVVYERDLRPGGHSATVDIDHTGARMSVDTGFIVYNEENYPNLTAMFDWLGVATQPSDMSFSVSADRGRFEWCGRDGKDVVSGLFAQWTNVLSPSYLNMLAQILRFQKYAKADLASGAIGDVSLGHYMARFSMMKRLRDDYLIPMGAAIWSTSPKRMLDFPAESFLAFFENHKLLDWDRPKWCTVTGGSRSYVEKIVARYRPHLRLGSAVASVERKPHGVEVIDSLGHRDVFDHVVIAAHAPDALAMVQQPTDHEHEILGGVGYSDNVVYLHRDARLMPTRKAAWAAWNFLREGNDSDRKVAVTYWMNRLQALDEARSVFVTLNPPFEPDPSLVFGRFVYAHPQFDKTALVMRRRLPEIQGRDRIWYCGAWAGHGFHEDGLVSGLNVARALGGSLPWRHEIENVAVAAE